MGLFDLFKKNKQQKKQVIGPINCTIRDFLEIVRKLDDDEVFLPVMVFRYKGDVHRIGQMFDGDEVVRLGNDKTPAYIFDRDKYTSLEELVQYTILRNEEEFIEIQGYGSGEYDDLIDKVVCDEFYLDGRGEFWQLKGCNEDMENPVY